MLNIQVKLGKSKIVYTNNLINFLINKFLYKKINVKYHFFTYLFINEYLIYIKNVSRLLKSERRLRIFCFLLFIRSWLF